MIREVDLKGLGPFKTRRRFAFKPGLNVLVGPCGSGKTTVVRVIAALAGNRKFLERRGGSLANKACPVGSAAMKMSSGREVLRVGWGGIEMTREVGEGERVLVLDSVKSIWIESAGRAVFRTLERALERADVVVADDLVSVLDREHQKGLAGLCGKGKQLIVTSREWDSKIVGKANVNVIRVSSG